MTTILRQLNNWLLAPHRRLTDPEKIQRSRLLSAIMLVFISTAGLILTAVLRSHPDDINEPTVQGGFLLIGISLVMYILARSGFTSIPAMGIILPITVIFLYIPFYSGEDPVFLAFLLISIILTAIFFPLQWTVVTSIVILTLVAILLSLVDQNMENTPYWNLRNMLFLLILVTALILTFIQHLQNLEKIRQKELRRINKELEDKVAELERFNYTISHELKTPIVTLKGFIGSIRNDLKDKKFDRAEKDLSRVSTAADKLNDTLSGLLEFSKIRTIANPPSEIDTDQLIKDALEKVDNQILSRNITIIVASNLPNIHGDQMRIREVFENLIDNAVKYMGEQDNPIIEIGVRNQAGKSIFYVKDNGLGIEEQYKEKIFGLFEKLDPTIEGSGIGLTLVKRIIETHGGKIWIESDGLGKGSAFSFTIPNKRE